MTSRKGGQVGGEGLRETLDGKVVRRRREAPPNPSVCRGRNERRRRVMSFQHKLAAEHFIAAHVRSADEFGKDFEMRLLYLDRAVGGSAVLQHKKVAKERLGAAQVGTLTVRGPEIKGTSDRLFRPVVEVVAEGWTDLGLSLDRGKKCLLAHYEQVPLLSWPKEARQLDGLLPEDMPLRNPGRRYQFREKVDESIHLRAAGDGATQSLVGLAGLPLLILLSRPSLPIVGDCPPGTYRQITQYVFKRHRHAVSDSSRHCNRRTAE